MDWYDASILARRHFEYTREGGRASQRATDFVRRRLWHKKAASSDANAKAHSKNGTVSDGVQQAARAMSHALVSPATVMSGARSGNAHIHLVVLDWYRRASALAAQESQRFFCAEYASKQRQSAGKASCAYLWACLRGASSAIRSGMLCRGTLVHGESCS